MINILMVEDEMGATTVFKNLLNMHNNDFYFMGVAQTVRQAVKQIEEYQPDVVILDISLPDGTGFDVLDIIGEINFEVVFLTAHENFALKAIKNNAFDYLLKPLQSKEMHEVLRKVKVKIEGKQEDNALKKIALNTIDGVEFINVDEIKYLKAASNYTEIFMQGGEKLLASKTLKSFEILLGNPFYRVHKSYVLNTKLIKKYDKSDGVVYLSCGKAIPISKSKKEAFLTLVTRVV